jgi:hypothetical protein
VSGFVVGRIIKVDGVVVFQHKGHDYVEVIPAAGGSGAKHRVSFIAAEVRGRREAVPPAGWGQEQDEEPDDM